MNEYSCFGLKIFNCDGDDAVVVAAAVVIAAVLVSHLMYDLHHTAG